MTRELQKIQNDFRYWRVIHMPGRLKNNIVASKRLWLIQTRYTQRIVICCRATEFVLLTKYVQSFHI